MINLLVDEAYAFDYLCILRIKSSLSEDNLKNWQNCYNYLKLQINNEALWSLIINSNEFFNLENVNKKTFDAVEKARRGNISAKEVDDANMERHYAKLALQKKFFNKNLTEYKT